MKFSEIVEQAGALLQRTERVSYRVLKREFDLDDEGLEDLKEALLFSYPQAQDEGGRGLVLPGDGAVPVPLPTLSQNQTPASYTPQHLAERILAEQAAMESRGSANGERKTITALFADLKGSTALIEGLDPEDARAIIDPALQLMMDAVHRYDGYVAQALGDGIFALFGAPIAHEDHPQRALYAALLMQEEMRSYGDQVRLKHGVPLQMRVGINTGEVVVRSIRKDDLHTDYVPVGHSTNLAARMEQIATPGSIVISEYTRKLTEGYFELKALGAATIKGVEEPLNVYEVLGVGPLRTRLQVSARRGLTRFVGRHSELEQMQQALEQAKAGHGQIAGVMGEPGLGKSRLFYEFKLTSLSGCFVLEAFSVSHGKASPYMPIIELLKAYFQIEPTDDERQRQSKVQGQVLALDRSLEDTLPYLFSLLGVEDEQSSLQHMDAQIRRQRTFEALKKLFFRESLNQPLMLIFEDLHWIDTETQGFLDTLSESVASAQLLLLVNYRPEYRHDWGSKTYYTQLRLAPLGQAEAEELLTFLLGNDTRLTALKALILERTEGTPFFMEEVVQTLAEERVLVGEHGNYRLEKAPTELHISPTVQGVLAARIDRLATDEKELLQQLSVIGRQFPVSLVKHVISQTETELHRVLASLQAKEFLYEQPAFPEVEYLFKHALTQDVAYSTVLQEQRRALHERTGQAMEALYPDRLAEYYSELAYHYQQSGNAEKAVEYLYLAGQQATQRSAHEEAIRNLSTALELLKSWPATPNRDQQELDLQIALGVPLITTRGYCAPEVEHAYSRARALCPREGESTQLFPILWGLWICYAVQAAYTTAHELAEQGMQLAERLHDPALLLQAHYMVGVTAFHTAPLPRAREHLEQLLAIYDPEQHSGNAFDYGQDPGVTGLCILGETLRLLGYPDQARTRMQAGFTLAQTLAHPFSLSFTLGWNTSHAAYRGEGSVAQDWAERAVAFPTEHGFEYQIGFNTILQGWVRAKQGQVGEGLRQLREGLTRYQATGAKMALPTCFAWLTEAYIQGDQRGVGLATVAEGLALVDQTGERVYEAELYRLKGELLSGQSNAPPQAASACYQKAIAIAQKQNAKLLELRASTSLARLWQQQGKKTEAREILSPVYAWFTEGFDTADLKDAKSLLEELA